MIRFALKSFHSSCSMEIWRTRCKSVGKDTQRLLGEGPSRVWKKGGWLVAMKTGISIWNPRDFQDVIEDVEIDAVTQGGSIEWQPKEGGWGWRNSSILRVEWRRVQLYRRLTKRSQGSEETRGDFCHGSWGGKALSVMDLINSVKWKMSFGFSAREALIILQFSSVQFSSVTQSCLTLCNPMNHSTPGLPVHHQLPEFTQTHVHRVGDAIQPSHPLSSPSSPAQHQSLFQWVNSSHQVAKVFEVQPQHHSFLMNTQDWSLLGWISWISLQSKGLARVFFSTTVQKHQYFGDQLSSQSNSHIHTWTLEKP